MAGLLPNDEFLTSEKVIELLKSECEGLPKIPNGSKDNVFFIIHNSENLNRRCQGRRSAFDDDCGVWNDVRVGTSRYA